MLSEVPVAMAILPVKVEQPAMADASPAFWTVVVAAEQLLAPARPAGQYGDAFRSLTSQQW